MEKKIIDGVYTILGIDSTSQVREFYQEIVDGNYEKYVAISTQGIKFKFNHDTDKAELLQPNETYAINPMYRKIEVTPIEDLVKEQTEKEQNDVIAEEINAQPTQEVLCEDECAPIHDVEVPSETTESQNDNVADNAYNREAYEELNNNYVQLKALYDEQNKNIKFEKERADVAEQDLSLTKEGYKKIKEQLDEKSNQLEEALVRNDELLKQLETLQKSAIEYGENEHITIDSITQMALDIGYEIFFKKI